jgi:hypothetical protein
VNSFEHAMPLEIVRLVVGYFTKTITEEQHRVLEDWLDENEITFFF